MDKKRTTLIDRRKADRTLRKVTLYSVLSLALVILGVLCFLFFIALKSQPTVEYYNLPFPTDKLEYHPTDSIRYKIEFRKHTNVPADVSRQLICVNGEERYSRSLQGGISGIDETPQTVEYETTTVITSATPGDVPLNVNCHIETTSKYTFNAFKVEYARGRTGTFQFVPANVPLRDNPAINQPSRMPVPPTTQIPAVITPDASGTTNTSVTNNGGTTIENTGTQINPEVNLPNIDLNLPDLELNRIINPEITAPVEKPKTEILTPITSPVGGLIKDLLK